LRILLADDDAAMLKAASECIPPDCEIAGTYPDGATLLEGALALDPDVIILDVGMPGMNGFETARQLRLLQVRAAIIFLSAHQGEDFVSEGFAIGASAYVFKVRMHTDLRKALQAVTKGELFSSNGRTAVS
jgi:DNA-binding NarL/FixJ family response regulator